MNTFNPCRQISGEMDQVSESNENLGGIVPRQEEEPMDDHDNPLENAGDENDLETCEPSLKRLKMDADSISSSPNKFRREEEGIVISLATTSASHSLPSSEEKAEVRKLKDAIERKEEELRKLELVQHYRNKWSKEELKAIIGQWKLIATASFEDLYAKTVTCDPDVTREDLLEHLHVDPKLIDLELH